MHLRSSGEPRCRRRRRDIQQRGRRRALLDSLPALWTACRADVVVVDNGSTDDAAWPCCPSARTVAWSGGRTAATGGHQRRGRRSPAPRAPPSSCSTPTCGWTRARSALLVAALELRRRGIAAPRVLDARRGAGPARCGASRPCCALSASAARAGPRFAEYVQEPAAYEPPTPSTGRSERCCLSPAVLRRAGRLGRVVLPLLRGDRLLPAGARPRLADPVRPAAVADAHRRRRRAGTTARTRCRSSTGCACTADATARRRRGRTTGSRSCPS